MIKEIIPSTVYIELKSLSYIRYEPRLILFGLSALISALGVVSCCFYVVYIRHGIHVFDQSTYAIVQDISVVDSSFTGLIIILLYMTLVNLFSNFFYCAIDYAVLKRRGYFISCFTTIRLLPQLLQLTFFMAVMVIFEENFFARLIRSSIRFYAASLGLDLYDEKLPQALADIFLARPYLADHRSSLKEAFVGSKNILYAAFGKHEAWHPRFSFAAWDVSLLIVLLVSFVVHFVLAYWMSLGLSFVLFFITIQIFLSLNHFARAIFHLLVYQYCVNHEIPLPYKRLVEHVMGPYERAL